MPIRLQNQQSYILRSNTLMNIYICKYYVNFGVLNVKYGGFSTLYMGDFSKQY